MNTCKTCKFWDKNWRGDVIPGWNWCLMAENNYDNNPHPESLAVAEDREQYHASLRTHENFGCTQHQTHVEAIV